MRVLLLHNASSGSEDHTDEKLREQLGERGYEVVASVAKPRELPDVLPRTRCDLVVVAGGDGTVGRAAARLAGRGLPLAILPLGTANNIARTLDIDADAADISTWIDGWRGGMPRAVDLALATVAGRPRPFFEALGFGVFPEVMRIAEQATAAPDRAHELRRDLALFRSMVAAAKPAFYAIETDAGTYSGEYLLVEIMNIPYLGPHLPLSPTSRPDDGALELCLVGEADRAALLALIGDVLDDRPSRVALPTHPVRSLSIREAQSPYHVDGDHFTEPPAFALEVRVQAGAVQLLA